MSLQGHEKAARIIAEALMDQAEELAELTDPQARPVSIVLTYFSIAMGKAAERMDAEIRAGSTS